MTPRTKGTEQSSDDVLIRVALYVNPREYRLLKKVLSKHGQSVSFWLREKIRKEVSK